MLPIVQITTILNFLVVDICLINNQTTSLYLHTDSCFMILAFEEQTLLEELQVNTFSDVEEAGNFGNFNATHYS